MSNTDVELYSSSHLKQGLEKKTILLLVITLIFISGCIFTSDKGVYTPIISCDFPTTVDLRSLVDELAEYNITYEYKIDPYCKEGKDHDSLYISFDNNTTYILHNTTYNISKGTRIFIQNCITLGGPWMRIRLHGIQYEFRSYEEAINSTYLIEPAFELTKLLLIETGNPMPINVKYRVWGP